MLETTLGYLEKDGQWLMLHRTKKKKDINKDKWIGIGGKLEAGETPAQCMVRECLEETGLTWHEPELKAAITFSSLDTSSNELTEEIMYLFSGKSFSGQLKECDEGELCWVDKEKVFALPSWEGDALFLSLLMQNAPYFTMELKYTDGKLIKATLNEMPLNEKERERIRAAAFSNR